MDNQIKQATPEDIYVAKVSGEHQKQYRLTPKYNEWERLFLDKTSKETFGNATQSAIRAYNLDPVGQYEVAMTIGKENTRKHRHLARKYYEKMGKSQGELMNILWTLMLARKDVDLAFYFGEIMGLELPAFKPVTNATYVAKQENNQFNIGGDLSLSFIKEGETNASKIDSGSVRDSNGQSQI